MKILSDFGINKNIGITAVTGTLLFVTPCISAQNITEKDSIPDTFELRIDSVTPNGSKEKTILIAAPSPEINIAGEEKNAVIVVDLSNNILYKYNEFGEAEEAFLVASGKKRTPTQTGVRVVTHVETYPYKSAPESTRRRRKPRDYGPKIICLEKIDPETGAKSSTGQFIHGNNSPNSLGKYASLGCIRMDNEVIKSLAKQVKRGDIVIIKEQE